ncbi:MAG: LpxD N-terminal domain-containing protein, partial [Rhodanobacteraceae bacterium]
MNDEQGHRIDELAERFGLLQRGDGGGVSIRGVATLATAQSDQLAFLANPRYAAQLADTRAGAVVLREEYAAVSPVPALIADDPYLAFAKIAALFDFAPAS